MGFSSNASTPAVAPTPPEPATVKRTESEVAKARSDAKSAATRKYGISGTNITKGALIDTSADVKKNKLGGN
jgi:hypothetical protein